MGNTPELVFVITISITFAIIALLILAGWTACVVAIIREARRWKRNIKAERARDEIRQRELLRAIRASRRTEEDYWTETVRAIDKEYRAN